MKRFKISLNKSIINKADSSNRKTMMKFTSEFENFELTQEEIFSEITVKGFAFCSAYLKENEHGFCYKKEDNFIGSNVLAVDVDNTNKDGSKKSKEQGYCSFEEIQNIPIVKELSSFVYTTPSHKKDHHRFRIVFLTAQFVNDKERYKKAITSLNQLFGGDPATTSVVQGFYGCKDANSKYFGKLFTQDDVSRLVEIYDENKSTDLQKVKNEIADESEFTLEEIDEIVKYIFLKGNIANEHWWKVPTILNNNFNLSEDDICNIIKKYTELGDTLDKIEHASRYKNYFTKATLIWLAKKNGYELPDRHVSNSYFKKFWSIEQVLDKSGNLSFIKCHTSDYKFEEYVTKRGYYLFKRSDSFDLVKTSNNIIYNSTEEDLRREVLDALDDNNLYDNKMESNKVKDVVRKDMKRLIPNTMKNLRHLNKSKEFKIIKDNETTSYLFYENGVREITKNSEKIINYKDVNGFVRSDKILDREFIKSDGKKSIIQKYLKCLSTNRLEDGKLEFNEEKYHSLVSIIGYLATNYKKKDNPVAIVLTDYNLTLSDESEGGSGKSLFAKIISHIRKQVNIDGRNFRSDADFKLDQIDDSTDVCLINDCSYKFPFESFYNYITDDLTIQKKYKSSEIIPFENSPKFIFTTNSVLGGDGSSDRRRRLEVEVSNYFNLNHKPSDEFGILFDWSDDEWARYDDFIGKCLRYYYKNGLLTSEPEFTKYKRLEEVTSPEFAEYASLNLKNDELYWVDSISEDFTQLSKIMLTPHKLFDYMKCWANYNETNMFTDYIRSQSNRRFVVFSSDKSKNLPYWKKTKEYDKLKLKVDTTPSKLIGEM